MMGFFARGFHQLAVSSQVLLAEESSILNDLVQNQRPGPLPRSCVLQPIASLNSAVSGKGSPNNEGTDKELQDILVGRAQKTAL